MSANPAYIASSCSGKVAFASFTLANAVVTRNRDKYREGRTSYHCQHCQQWHIGSDNGQRARGRHERNTRND